MSDQEKTEIDFPLTTAFSYASGGGGTDEAKFIRLTAPSSKNSRECAALKQAFFRAVPRNQETTRSRELEDEEITGDDVITTMAMSRDVDLPDVLDVARKLFTAGVARIDGEAKLTQGMIDRMSQEDLEQMLGAYMVGFTLASSLARMREKSSEGS